MMLAELFFQDIKNLALESVRLVKCGRPSARGDSGMWGTYCFGSNRRNPRNHLEHERVAEKTAFFCFPSHWSGLIRCSLYGHTNASRKLVDERMKGTNVRLEYSPERLAWHRWHLHQHMAVTCSSMAVSLGRSWTSPWMCAMVWWMCWDLGLGRCNWGWLMSKLASDFHRVEKRSVLTTFRKAHLVIQKN